MKLSSDSSDSSDSCDSSPLIVTDSPLNVTKLKNSNSDKTQKHKL